MVTLVCIGYTYSLIRFATTSENEKLVIKTSYKIVKQKGKQGTIYDRNGKILAISITYYDLFFDSKATPDKNYELLKAFHTIGACLKNCLPSASIDEIKKKILDGTKKGHRSILIARDINYEYIQKIKECKINKESILKYGFYLVKKEKRFYPYGNLMKATIGEFKEGIKSTGIEGGFLHYLSGQSGQILMRREAGGMWLPLESDLNFPAQEGASIYTTLDIYLGNIVSEALKNKMEEINAIQGCAILMHVQSGDIYAMVNLTKSESGEYIEGYNMAVGEIFEPGSTFKTAILLALLEHNYITLEDTVFIGNGEVSFYNHKITDIKKFDTSTITIKNAFAYSSNVAFSTLAYKFFHSSPLLLITTLAQFGLKSKTGIGLPEEINPYIKSFNTSDWYGTTIPWMGIGYELRISPLLLTTFYNAIANGGKMIKPKIVEKIIMQGNKTIEFKPEYISNLIARKEAIEKVKEALEEVVKNGTAKTLSQLPVEVAGKTGTALISQLGKGYNKSEEPMYMSSFVGYFPAKDPMFTIYIGIISMNRNLYYGGMVAAPVAGSIIKKIMNNTMFFAKKGKINNSN